MKWISVWAILIMFLATACGATETETGTEPTAQLMTWSDLTSRPLPDPNSTHIYGDHPAQIVDLWLPDGEGPHPVVFMIHGGCWQKSIADRTLMNYAADDLRQRGLAVWNIEYRGVDEDGGGYPGTFQDVSAAAELLLDEGPALGLDLDRIAGFGHSAGGHLITWLASSQNLPDTSPLNVGQTFQMAAVINSGGLADLAASKPVTLESCLADIIDDLTGEPSDDRPNVFSDTSPAELLPANTTVISVNGDGDRIAPQDLGIAFTDKLEAAGGDADYVEVPNSGHVELVSPRTGAFDTQAELLLEALSQ